MIEPEKYAAAEVALNQVHDGMLLGLGSGSTANAFIDLLGQRLKAGTLRDVRGVPTSLATAQRASDLGIPLLSLSELVEQGKPPLLDLAVDGADEVDPQLNLIKGLGRALLREKLVEIHAQRFVVIVTTHKLVQRLGEHAPLPVEIVRFEAQATVHWLAQLGCRAELWLEDDGTRVVTDNGNYLARCWFAGGIPDPAGLAAMLANRPGVVEHGLFLDMAQQVVVAGAAGVQVLDRPNLSAHRSRV